MSSLLEETYDKIAEQWHQDHSLDDWWIEGTEAFISHLPKNGSVLDVGCGSGVKSKYFLDRGFQVTGIDISNNLLQIAKEVAPNASFEHLSMMNLGEVKKSFDGVFAQASLLHVPKKNAHTAIQKMADRIVPDGYLYIAVKERRSNKPEETIEKENDYGFEYERFFSYFTMPELEKYLTDARLEVVYSTRTVSPSGNTTWLQIIGKK